MKYPLGKGITNSLEKTEVEAAEDGDAEADDDDDVADESDARRQRDENKLYAS